MASPTSTFCESFPESLSEFPQLQQVNLIRRLWQEIPWTLDTFNGKSYAEFFRYLDAISFQLGQSHGTYFVGTFEDITQLCEIWKSQYHQPLSTVIQSVSSRLAHADHKSIQRSLELSVRMWLTINVNSRSVAWGHFAPFQKPLQWPLDMSLQSLIESRFVSSRMSASNMPYRIEGYFTAAHLVNVCGMTLHWTDHLSDHLRPDPQRRVLTVYKHKICLINHLKESCPIPKDVLEEAMNTLNLLFPFGDPATERLLTREGQQELYRLGNCNKERRLDSACYDYWREELETLIDICNHPPRTWKQLVMDRRNLIEWAAFWMTVMVAFLTLVSIPCNIIQAAYSVKAYQATVAQGGGCSCQLEG